VEPKNIRGEALLFFDGHPGAIPLYLAFDEAVRKNVDVERVKVQKTQISYYNKYLFACVSLLPVRKAKDRPRDYITVTLGLDHALDSPRVDAVSEPYPGRFTHHMLISSIDEIDEELMEWVKQAADFAGRK